MLYAKKIIFFLLPVCLAVGLLPGCRPEKDEKGHNTMVDNSSGRDDSASPQCGLPLSDSELKKLLTPEQYRVIRQNGTEQPFANEYWDLKEAGLYVDRVTGKALFTSREKFDSGTGWPSFFAPVHNDCLKEIPDRSNRMVRTEVRAAESDSHLGHVFDDGPGPGGKRYCINSAALRFIPADKLEEEGFGDYLHLFEKETGMKEQAARETALFGAGCFWGVEAAFRKRDGVIDTSVGYAGGRVDNPTYQDVCTGKTGHAEVVQVTYDPSRVSFDELLDLFWQIHDPTTLNRQGPDLGTQYRSAIFFHSPEQEAAARASLERAEASGRFKKKIVTEIAPAADYFRAEEYHQRFVEKHGGSSCKIR